MIRQEGESAGIDGFVWFFGVVEDRNDPLNAGRVKVRCYDWHSDDKNAVPTASLPWAQVMMPPTSASKDSVGMSGTGLLEGTDVIGFFLDGKNAHQPFILGSYPGVGNKPAGLTDKGFQESSITSDNAEQGMPDTPRLAYDRWTEDKITKDKDTGRVTDITTAARSTNKAALTPLDITPITWEEPKQRGDKLSVYPFNHVHQTETGHAFEIDDSNDCERIHQYHRTGTFYEIQPDGSRMTKIIGDDYEICAQNKNVLIKGNCNITVTGDARLYFESDLIQEVKGDYSLTVHGNHYRNIKGNESTEINSSRTINVGIDESTLISGKRDTNIGTTDSLGVGTDKSQTVGRDYLNMISGNSSITVLGTNSQVTIRNLDIGTAATLNIASGSTTNVTAIGNYKVVSPRIDFNP